MIPRNLPAGTTLRALVTELIPADHAANVAKEAGDAKVCIRFTGGASYTLDARGDRLTVTETPRIEQASLLLSVDESTAQLFLDDWLGPQKLAPSFEPHGLTSITDARFLRKVSSVKGVLSLTLDDFEGHAATLLIAAGPDASVYDDPDAEIHIKLPAFLRILAGKLGPDEAIAEGHVTLTGKKLVAMQFALAVAPYFPPKPAGGAKSGRG
jgi:putative sterol carrier protein